MPPLSDAEGRRLCQARDGQGDGHQEGQEIEEADAAVVGAASREKSLAAGFPEGLGLRVAELSLPFFQNPQMFLQVGVEIGGIFDGLVGIFFFLGGEQGERGSPVGGRQAELLQVVVLADLFGGKVAGDAGDGGGINVRRQVAGVGGQVLRVVLLEPVEVAIPDLGPLAEPAFEGGPAALRQAAERAHGGELGAGLAGAAEFLEEVVVGVDLLNGRPRRKSCREAEIGPVAPLMIDVVPADPGGFPELEEGDVRAGTGGEVLELGEEFVLRWHWDLGFAEKDGFSQRRRGGGVRREDGWVGELALLTLRGFVARNSQLGEVAGG